MVLLRTLRVAQLIRLFLGLCTYYCYVASIDPETDAMNSTSTRMKLGSISSDERFRHYFRQEFNLLTNQAAMLGDYHPNDDESRLKFQLKALQVELAYIHNLHQNILDFDRKRHDNVTTTCEEGNEKRKKRKRRILTTFKKIKKTIISRLPRKGGMPIRMQSHHGYDFDWIDENGSFELYDELDCYEHARTQRKRLYTDDDWHSLWQKFQDASLYPYPIPKPAEQLYYTSYSDGKGRGNFASRNIKKNEMIYNGYENAVFFQEGRSFKRFLSLLSREAACDVLEWSFMQDLTNDGNAVLGLDMYGGALFNDGSPHQNMQYKDKSSLNKYATRDIEKGEELTEVYDEFTKTEIDL